MNRNLNILNISQATSILNDNMLKNALVTMAVFTNHSGGIFTAIMSAIFISPFIFFSGLSGKIVDNTSKNTQLRFLKASEFISSLLALLAIYLNNNILMGVVVFILGMQGTYLSPLRMSIIPLISSPKNIARYNGIIEGTGFIAIVIGTLLGTTIEALHHAFLYLFIITSFLSFTGFISSLFIHIEHPVPQQKISFRMYKISIDALKAIPENNANMLAVHMTSFWCLCTLLITLFPNIAQHIQGGTQFTFSFLLIVFSIGMGIGSLLGQYIQISLKYLKISIILLSCAVLINHLIPILTLLFITSLMIGIWSVNLYTVLQTTVQEDKIGFVTSGINIWNSIGMCLISLLLMLLNMIHTPFYIDILISVIFMPWKRVE